ncbi:hypothetical protein [Chitinophaga alhagiae]|uniref:hypothetical protein n=1 Tax=Chitinophaga alhagiae TaxID=2203219 RepID=UPI000E5BD4D8|nr:hypothetical protein [Chitinophaga alhagiae]
MTTKTRTFKTRGSKTPLGRFFRVPGLIISFPLLAAGIAMRLTWLMVLAAALLCCTLAIRLVRNRTVVSLDEKGIRYSSPFRQLQFEWHEIQAAGVYYVKNGEVFEEYAAGGELPEQHCQGRTIFVSTRSAYSPARHRRLVNRTDLHFRWNREAWKVIAARCDAATLQPGPHAGGEQQPGQG